MISHYAFSATTCAPGSGRVFSCFNQSEVDSVFLDLTSAFAPASVIGAGSLGKVFGIELGLVVSASEAPNTERIVQQYDPDLEIPGIPMAGLSGIISLPYGLGAEVTVIPKVDLGDEGSFESLSLGARWTLTDIFPLGILNIALRSSLLTSNANYTYSEDSGNILIGTVTEDAEFDIKTFEIGAVFGLKFRLLEPYAGFSVIESSGGLKVDTTSTTGSANNEDIDESSSAEGVRAYGGLTFKLPLIRLGLEVAHFQDINRASFKLGFKF